MDAQISRTDPEAASRRRAWESIGIPARGKQFWYHGGTGVDVASAGIVSGATDAAHDNASWRKG